MANDKTQTSTPTHGSAPGAKEMAQAEAEHRAQGYIGIAVDPTPNENYTVKGVTSGAPTPETDSAQAAKVADHQRKIARGELA